MLFENINFKEENYNLLIHFLTTATGLNFNYYKRKFIEKRIKSRMIRVHCYTIDSYFNYLQENPTEIKKFLKSFLKNQVFSGKLTLTNCKFNNDIVLIGTVANEIVIELNNANSTTLSQLQAGKVLIRDNIFNDLKIDESHITQLTLLTYTPAGVEPAQIKNFFQALNTIKYTQISNQIFGNFIFFPRINRT